MKIDGVKKEWANPVFVHFKKHFCPKCGRPLTVVKRSKIVDSASEEAKKYDFSLVGGSGFFVGNVKFVWMEFHCKHCRKRYSVEQTRQNDMMMKK